MPKNSQKNSNRPSQKIHSWFYWAVEPTRRFQSIFLAILICLLIFICAYFINPRFSPGGWNTIDHIEDRRPGNDYSQAEIRAMASSQSWIGLATNNGLTMLNKDSRLARENIIAEPIQDITRGNMANDFLVLKEDQEVDSLAMEIQESNTKVWLSKANHVPVSGADPSKVNVVAAGSDQNGWLLAIKGWGIERYPFVTSPSGQILRSRSWLANHFSNIPLDLAVLTQNGIWFSEQKGGIHYADRISLIEEPTRALRPGDPIVKLDADYAGQWANASDSQGRLWIYTHTTGWSGPYFGLRPSDKECQAKLSSLRDVTLTRGQKAVVWMGSKHGLFAYPMDSRHMFCVLPDAVTGIIVSEASPDASTTPVIGQALVSTHTGLYRVQFKDGEFASKQLDSNSIDNLSLSTDEKFLVYRVQNLSSSVGAYEWRAIQNPFSATAQPNDVLVSAQGWLELAAPPKIVGIEMVGQKVLFGTSQGAFLYDPIQHKYTDQSGAIAPNSAKIKLVNFTDLHKDGETILGIADQQPFSYQPTQNSKSEQLPQNNWLNLDPDKRTNPIQITQVSDQVIGLGPKGELYNYQSSSKLQTYAASQVEWLKNTSRAVTIGDLAVDGDRWSAALLNEKQVLTYNSANGEIAEYALPSRITLEQLTKIHFVNSQLLYQTKDNQLISQAGDEIFGKNSLPFDPMQPGMLAPAKQENQVLWAGGDYVIRYDWKHGTSEIIGGGPFPAVEKNKNPVLVVELQDTDNAVWARTDDHRIFYSSGPLWTEVAGRRWATDKTGSNVWILRDTGIVSLVFRQGKLQSEQTFSASSGQAMQSFVENAIFGWNATPVKLFFFSKDAKIGVYDSLNDVWAVKNLEGLITPQQFIPYGSSLIVIGSNKIIRITNDLKINSIISIPANTKNVSAYISGNILQLAYMQENTAVLQKVNLETGGSNTYYRGGTVANFSTEKVVYAEPGMGSQILLMDESGNIAYYNYLTGQWTPIYQSPKNYELYAWHTTPDGKTALILASKNINDPFPSIIIPLRDPSSGRNVTLKPDQIEKISSQAIFYSDCDLLPVPACMYVTSNSKVELKKTGLDAGRFYYPKDGVVLQSASVRIVRENGQASYLLFGANRLHPIHNGFAEDQFQGVTLVSDQLLALQKDTWVILKPGVNTNGLLFSSVIQSMSAGHSIVSFEPLPTANTRLILDNGDSVIAEKIEGDRLVTRPLSPQQLAEINFLTTKLVLQYVPDGGVRTEWQSNPSLPIWSGGNLAIQDIQDIAFSNNKLLVATKMGVLVRNPGNYSLQIMYTEPVFRDSRFDYSFPSGNLYIKTNAGYHQWNGTLANQSEEALTNSVDLGPWQCTITSQKTIACQDSSGKIRSSIQTDKNQWKFTDDMIEQVLHSSKTGEVCFYSSQHKWQFDPKEGRLNQSCQAATELVISYNSPAIKIVHSESTGQLIFTPVDSRIPIFENGRFFLDNGSMIGHDETSLLILIPRYGIVRRDIKNFAKIYDFWLLPPDLLTQSKVDVKMNVTSLEIIIQARWQDGRSQAWGVDFRDPSATWQVRAIPEKQMKSTSSLVSWEDVGDAGYQPLIAFQGKTKSLETWWSLDRFAWDRVNCAGAVNGFAILSTPIGPLALRTSDLKNVIALGPLSEVNFCAAARDENHPVGILIGRDIPQYFISSNQENIVPTPYSMGDSLLKQPILKIGYTNSTSDRQIGIWQEWVSYELSQTQIPRVESTLLQIPIENLLKDGQFVFDRAAGGYLLESDLENKLTLSAGSGTGINANVNASLAASSENILTYSQCQDGEIFTCVIALNQKLANGRLVLRDMWPINHSFYAIRPASPNSFWGLYPIDNGNSWGVVKESVMDNSITWENARLEETGTAFQKGENLTINVYKQQWLTTPSYIWNFSPLSVIPQNYPLFVREKNGIGFSFDVITSLSTNPVDKSLAISTRGGVFICSSQNIPEQFLFVNNSLAAETAPMCAILPATTGVERARYQNNGLRIQANGKTGIYQKNKDLTWSDNANFIVIDDLKITSSGIEKGNKLYLKSNDMPFPSQQKYLDEIVDFALEDNEWLWIATKHQGIFKVLLSKLP